MDKSLPCSSIIEISKLDGDLSRRGLFYEIEGFSFREFLNITHQKNYSKINVKRDVRFVDNGNVITTAGVSAGIDGALHMVAKLQGLKKAKEVAFYMEYDKWKPGEGLLLSADNPYGKKQKKK